MIMPLFERFMVQIVVLKTFEGIESNWGVFVLFQYLPVLQVLKYFNVSRNTEG